MTNLDDPAPTPEPPAQAAVDLAVPDEHAAVIVASRPRRKKNVLVEWLIVIAVAIAAALVVKTFVTQQFQVVGSSMDSTLHTGDRVLVNKLSYRLHDPNRGDVVVLETIDGTTEKDLIKRVIGLPGETVDIRECHVFIDGKQLDEPYLDPQIAPCTQPEGYLSFPLTVPSNQVFVMGDNRGGSRDSRSFGAVKYSDLVGRAFVVIWPTSDWKWL